MQDLATRSLGFVVTELHVEPLVAFFFVHHTTFNNKKALIIVKCVN